MTQTIKNIIEIGNIEIEEIEHPTAQESVESEVDELLGDLNPRFFEETISLNEAKDRIHSAKAYSNYSFNTYGF